MSFQFIEFGENINYSTIVMVFFTFCFKFNYLD